MLAWVLQEVETKAEADVPEILRKKTCEGSRGGTGKGPVNPQTRGRKEVWVGGKNPSLL